MKLVNDAIKAGGAGVSAGRNIFQHENPELLTKITCKLIENQWSLDECFEHLNKELISV